MPRAYSIRLFIGCALLAFGSKSAVAADAAGNYAIWGLGQSSCFQFTKAHRERRYGQVQRLPDGLSNGLQHFVGEYL